MELGIMQNEISEIVDNPIDMMGNKIKLKGTSLKNSINHIKNVPYRVSKGQEIKSSTVKLSEESKKYNLSPKQYVQLVIGPQKPINVKENMLNNMRSKYAAVAGSDIKANYEMVVDVSNTNVESDVEVNDMVDNTQDEVVEQKYDLSEFDNMKNELLSIKQKADTAQQEADKSEVELQEVAAQYTEITKQLQAAEEKNKLVRQQRTDAINNQGRILADIREKQKALIEEATARRESNQNKIIEFRTKIDDANEKILSINDDTARQQEIINALYNFENSDDIINFSGATTVDEESVKKIA